MKTNDSMKTNDQITSSGKQNGSLINMDSLINRVKNEDAKNLRITIAFQWIYILLTVIYAVLLFITNSDITNIRRISGVFYIASMVTFVLIFRYAYKEYKNIDYTLPLIEMLRSVANRYRLKTEKILFLLVPVFLMDAGVTLSFYEDLLPMTPLNRVLIVQVIYLPVMTISALIGVWIWSKKQKPLRDRAVELINELESE
jgi:hypothetical protein